MWSLLVNLYVTILSKQYLTVFKMTRPHNIRLPSWKMADNNDNNNNDNNGLMRKKLSPTEFPKGTCIHSDTCKLSK